MFCNCMDSVSPSLPVAERLPAHLRVVSLYLPESLNKEVTFSECDRSWVTDVLLLGDARCINASRMCRAELRAGQLCEEFRNIELDIEKRMTRPEYEEMYMKLKQ